MIGGIGSLVNTWSGCWRTPGPGLRRQVLIKRSLAHPTCTVFFDQYLFEEIYVRPLPKVVCIDVDLYTVGTLALAKREVLSEVRSALRVGAAQ